MKKRNDWKTFIFVIVIGITAMGIVIGCEEKNDNDFFESGFGDRTINKAPERIHPIEYNYLTGLFIIEVDGHQYLASEDGGICHLESCPCKNK